MKNKVIIISVLSVLLLISSLNLVMAEDFNQNEEQKLGFWGRIGSWFSGEVDELDQAACSNPIDFFHEYTIALNNFHVSSENYGLAELNVILADLNYFYIEDFYYEDAMEYYDLSKEQLKDAEMYLLESRKIFSEIGGSAPSKFYKEEISNRLKQTNILLKLVEESYKFTDYKSIEFYEITYGSESKATEYYDKAIDLIPTINYNLEQLSDISNKIDLAWGKNWYPEFQDSESY